MTQHPAHNLARVIGNRLAHPDTAPTASSTQPWWPQSLAHGVPGIALLHIELAAASLAPWQRAHDWLTAAVRKPVTTGADSHPYYGAPALAHALSLAADHLPGSYRRALDALDRQIIIDTRRRLVDAHRRIDQGHLPALAEFDALQGLTGYGAYLLRRDPDATVLRDVLDYLVHLTTQPMTIDGEALPGWWTPSGPSGRKDNRFPDGHGNNGTAHGVTGVLNLLSLAARHGTVVNGQLDTIDTICGWLDRWRTDSDHRPTWPYWITRAELRAGKAAPHPPLRPSWCYGTAGLARGQQLAALAVGDAGRQSMAENALMTALTDHAQLAATTDISLCHGFAGLARVAHRAAADALPQNRTQIRALISALLDTVHPLGRDPEEATTVITTDPDRGPGLLDGAAGIALAVLPPHTTWDSCLLIA